MPTQTRHPRRLLALPLASCLLASACASSTRHTEAAHRSPTRLAARATTHSVPSTSSAPFAPPTARRSRRYAKQPRAAAAPSPTITPPATRTPTQTCEASYARLPLTARVRRRLNARCRRAGQLPRDQQQQAITSICLAAVQDSVPKPLLTLERTACRRHPSTLYSQNGPS